MATALPPTPLAERPCVDHLVTEDDTPVDNFFVERQQILLTDALYSSWPGPGEGQRFVAAANVGVSYHIKEPALVPDFFLSLDVELPANIWAKHNRSYLIWEYGKPPDVAIEIVSDTRGDETGYKMRMYARIGILYYVIWDPRNILGAGLLRVFVLRDKNYVALKKPWLPVVGLGLTQWEGEYQGIHGTWLRWCDQNGQVLLTGRERADQERHRAEQERQRAEQERRRADQLDAQLRALGIEPAGEDTGRRKPPPKRRKRS